MDRCFEDAQVQFLRNSLIKNYKFKTENPITKRVSSPEKQYANQENSP